MKRITILISLALVLTGAAFAGVVTDFTSGNLVVLRVGDGVAALTSAATPTFLEEITTAGAAVQTIANPTTGVNMITNSGTASSEGALSLSPDGTYISFAGYNAAVGTTSIKGTASSAVNRIILSYDKKQNVTSSVSASAFTGDNIRSAVRNGSDYWAGGNGSTGFNGVQYFGTGTAAQVSSTVTNVRVVNIFNGQLYFSTGSGTKGIYKVGTGLPTATGETSVIAIETGGTSSPYAFSFNSTSDICYVADDRLIARGGGVMKYTKTAEVWSPAYTLASDVKGAVGLTVDWSGANPVIYATTTDNKVVKIVDEGASSVASVLLTGATNTAFRGIAFAPTLNPPTKIQSVNANAWSVSNNTLSFSALPTSNIEVYTLTGSKAAVYEPAQSIDLKLSKGVYILKVANQTSKIMIK